MGRVGACPHLIRHQYAWRFFVGCGRGFGGFIFLCEGRTAGASPRPTLFTGLSFGVMDDRRKRYRCSADTARAIRCTHMALCCSIVLHTLFSLRIARLFWREVCFAFIVWSAFWFCALVIEGATLKLPQACYDKSLICRLRALDRALFLAHCFVVLSRLCWAAWFAKTARFRSCQ